MKNPLTHFDNFYYQEIAKMTAAGGWGINFVKKESYIDPEGRRILNIPDSFVPKPKSALDFYVEEHHEKVLELINSCRSGKPFTAYLKMLTYDKKEFWARAIGKPLYDHEKNIVGVHGVFQDITSEKLKELSLENSLHLIEIQNSKLLNFAHIVSHNLRSHSSNLQLTLELMNSVSSEEERKEFMESLDSISKSLNDTIVHLNEIVNVQSKADEEKLPVHFEEILQQVKNSLNQVILKTKTEIYSDFSLVPSIKYIPAYMESIFLNLITNSIKYKHPDRPPKIEISTYFKNGSDYLEFKDNGIGIDLELYKDKVFTMYQTFHKREDSVGIGLFLIKNQVEALHGKISLESTVNKGTTFTIQFN
ncbi:PAS domain-containing sensor histidine kinase [Cochleicola gelatinilyticus]|uniref:histidine kinase n=1 Tax=Cochleicola gelatinilyticus TaxID=1763537 RepID=A0A167IXI2_9FLAO|nr:PAS domain-containing sensor histidine kinase [Cochleicola gelatinilyticus]OAB80112.1 hypothetical protein ULVI_05065 [Cochleicola gelatinilyticus]